ncbi:MAG: FtsX-like permease family protein [Candidatus Lokiarchaeota archaeon]|nr:FtsX-like permease family protein [Candidatus Harpocratesius repetitus]
MHFIRYGLNFFSQHKVRFWACLLGFSFALGSVFTIQGYVSIFSQIVENHALLNNNNYLVVEKGSNLIQLLPFDSNINENYTKELETIPHILACIPLIFKEFSNTSEYSWWSEAIIGIPFDDIDLIIGKNVQNYLESGKWPFISNKQILIGAEFSKKGLKAGDQVLLHNHSLNIGGLLQSINPLFDRCIFGDFSMIQSTFEMEGFCSGIFVLTDSIQQASTTNSSIFSIEEKIEESYPNLKVINQVSYKTSIQSVFGSFNALTQVISIFPLIISLIFLFVLIQLTFKERQSEMCILRAIGASNFRLFSAISFELMIMGVISFFIAIIVGFSYFGVMFLFFPEIRVGYSIRQYIIQMKEQIPFNVYVNTGIFAFFLLGIICLQILWNIVHMNIINGIKQME